MSAAFAQTIYVDSNTGDDARTGLSDWTNAVKTISNGVSKAGISGSVLVSNGVYQIVTNIVVTAGITLRSWNNGELDATNTIVNGNGATACLNIQHTNALVAGFTFTNGNGVGVGAGGYGGAVYIGSGGGTLSNCIVAGNTADLGGGGIYIHGAANFTSWVVNCHIYGNTQAATNGKGGGGIGVQRGGGLRDCLINDNVTETTAYYVGGGGVRQYGGYPFIMTDCVISNNESAFNGGGVALRDAGYVVSGNTIVNNRALTGEGGGVYMCNTSEEFIISSCTIEGNTAPTGGGIGLWNAAGLIINCVIRDNEAWSVYGGGGIRAAQPSGVIRYGRIKDSVITGNRAPAKPGGSGRGGGGLSLTDFYLVENCIITNNTAYDSGGVVMYLNVGTGTNIPTLRNCLVADNTAENRAGGVFIATTGIVENCTIVNNTALTNGGGLYYEQKVTNTLVSGTICYSNTAPFDPNLRINTDAPPLISYSCLTPTNHLAGAGNITDPPSFVDFANGNYRLDASSPCINKGVNQAWMINAFDLDGRSRVDRFSRLVDIGCYEHISKGTMYIFQ